MSSGGPNIISEGHHQRFRASCAMRFCSGVPGRHGEHDLVALALMEALFLAHAHHGPGVGPVGGVRCSGTWFMIAAPSTSQPMGADIGPGEGGVVEDG